MEKEDHYNQELIILKTNLKSLRKKKQFTQKDIQGLVKITQAQVSLLENESIDSNPEFETLIKLAAAFKVELYALFLRNDDESTQFSNRYSINKRLMLEKEYFGNRLLQLLKHRDIDQARLAVLADTHEAEITYIIQGTHNSTYRTIVNIAVALNVDTSCLFDYKGSLPTNANFKIRGERKRRRN